MSDQQREANLVTVCSNCLRAACWQGAYMCDEYVLSGTVNKTVGELSRLKLEHPSYWDIDPNTGCAYRGLGQC